MKQDNKVMIDTKISNVTNKSAKDIVTLKGVYPYEDTNYLDQLEVILEIEGTDQYILQSIPYSGYGIKLFLGDFTGDGQSDIMVRGDFGGTGNYGIAVIYTYEEGALKEIFNQDTYSELFECKSEYIEGYKVKITCKDPEVTYFIDLANKPSDYLNSIYTTDGRVKAFQEPTISGLNTAYPILPIYQDNYDLLIQQRVIGVANADTLGAVQTIGELSEGVFKIIRRVLLLYRQ